MMNNLRMVLFVYCVALMNVGCETAHQVTKQAGTVVGKGAGVVGGVTEGVTEGYKGSPANTENPYGR